MMNYTKSLSPYERTKVREILDEGGSVYEIRIGHDKGIMNTTMLGIRIIQLLTEIGVTLEITPSGDELLRGNVKGEIEILVVSKLDAKRLIELFRSALGLDDIVVNEVTPPKELLDDESLPMGKGLLDTILRDEETKGYMETKSLSISAEKLDELFLLVKELLLIRSLIEEEGWTVEYWGWMCRTIEELSRQITRIRLISLDDALMDIIRVAKGMVKDKEVDFIIDGGGIVLDKNIIDELMEPILSIIGNAIMHGIEEPEERMKKGKIRVGTIRIRAWRDKDYAVIEVEDDGRGINTTQLIKRAMMKGILNEELVKEWGTNVDLTTLLTMPGLSGQEGSGHLMSLSAIKSKLEGLGGSMDVWSEEGRGTRITLRVPISMTVIGTRVLVARIGDLHIALPLTDVVRIVRLAKDNVRTINGTTVIILDDIIIPVINIGQISGMRERGGYAVVARGRGGRLIGIKVDEVYSLKDVLVKPLPSMLNKADIFSGIAVLNRERLCLVLDTSAF